MQRGGKRPGSGRKKGGTNKITSDVRQAIMEAFSILGGAEYLRKVATEDPKAFCALRESSSPSRSLATRRTRRCRGWRSTPRPTKPESNGLNEPQESAGFLPPQLWVQQSGPLTEAIASRWCQEPWRPVAEEREQRQKTTRSARRAGQVAPQPREAHCLKSASRR